MPRYHFILIHVFLVAVVTAGVLAIRSTGGMLAFADEQTPPTKALVTKKKLAEALAQQRAMFVSGQTLRGAVDELQASTGVTVLLDRRLNPGTPIEISTGFVTVQETIFALANSIPETTASVGDHFVLVGPDAPTGRLRTLTEINRQATTQLRRKMDADSYRKLIARHESSWPNLSQPRQLILDAAEAAGLAVANPELIPHDLWAAARLPELMLADFATLVLNQFDLSFELSADGVVTIVPAPNDVAIEQRHRIPARTKGEVAKRWRAEFPDLPIDWKGATANVRATMETHDRLKQLISGDAPKTVAAVGIRNRLFTMTAPAGMQVESLLASLRGQGTPIRIEGKSDLELASLLQQTVQFEATRATAAEFFEMAFGDLGAKIEIGEGEVVLRFADD